MHPFNWKLSYVMYNWYWKFCLFNKCTYAFLRYYFMRITCNLIFFEIPNKFWKKNWDIMYLVKHGSKTSQMNVWTFFSSQIISQIVLQPLKCFKTISSLTRTKCHVVGIRFQKVKINYLRPWIEHGSHWINFIILTFIDENSGNFTHLHEFLKKNDFICHARKKRNI
jgi:hypothetical protein